eukprot:gene14029-biopygen20079
MGSIPSVAGWLGGRGRGARGRAIAEGRFPQSPERLWAAGAAGGRGRFSIGPQVRLNRRCLGRRGVF